MNTNQLEIICSTIIGTISIVSITLMFYLKNKSNDKH